MAWAIRAARHRALDLAQRRRVRCLPEEVLDLLEARWTDPAGVSWSDQIEALHRCLGQLASPARELLQMRYAGGLTAAMIANELHRTPDAIYQSLSRIHRALGKCVEQQLVRPAGPAAGGTS